MYNSDHSFIWMPLIGFDRDAEDKGVQRFIETAGCTPKGISVFLFHSDIVNEHGDRGKEFVLHPDNCSYYGAPCNEVRERQAWTNRDLQTLAKALKARGIEAYLGIMGVYLEDTRHKEWESNHLELLSFGEGGRMNLNVLKRFRDGRYYEDFFIDKLTKALQEYDFAGLHVSDFFCPPEHSISDGDFSTDMMEQFQAHSGVSFPEVIQRRLGFDDLEDIVQRKEYIWGQLRLEWIHFYAERWYRFWHKVCCALVPLGKKVMINNAWCSDPMEAMYRYGIDYKRLCEAGVSYIVCETVAEGMELVSRFGNCFNRFMTMSQLVSAYIGPEKQLSLLGVKDSTEEWDILHHATPRLERDIYALSSLYLQKETLIRSNSGLMVCLGDGLTADEWGMIHERMRIGYERDFPQIFGIGIVWADECVEAFLPAYIRTRRPSPQKIITELKDREVSFGAVIHVNELAYADSALFVPCFDLLSDASREKVLAYTKAPVICICGEDVAMPEGALCIEDRYANYKQRAYVLHGTNMDIAHIEALFAAYTAKVQPQEFYDHSFFTTPMPFEAMSEAFMQALMYILRQCDTSPFSAEAQMFIARISDTTYRLYVYNPENFYHSYKILSRTKIVEVNIVSAYPVIQPQMFVQGNFDEGDVSVSGAKYEAMHRYDPLTEEPDGFVAKVTPCGVSIFDVEVR